MSSIADRAKSLRAKAHAGPIGKRHSSFALYDLLGECMSLAWYCLYDRQAEHELRELVRSQETAGKGRWALPDSDVYLIVCRYIFPRTGQGKGELSNASRYAHCLREAGKRQLKPENLPQFLRTQGGLNALYLRRPLTRTSVRTKVLHLTESVEIPKDGEITLTMKRTPENTFEVLAIFNPQRTP